jgi:hypothetical protein
MSLIQQIRAAFHRRHIPPASRQADGYHLEVGPANTVVVRWGQGEPFDGTQAPLRCLRLCARSLTRQDFSVAPGVLGDQRGPYILVLGIRRRESPPRD